ncbi:hypothetical protein D3C76_979480 [compost metagenome]
MHQPQLDLRLEILQLQHPQRIAIAAAFEYRRRHQAQPPALGYQPELQFAAEGFQVHLQVQPLVGQRPLQPGAEAAAVRVEHPAMAIAIDQPRSLDIAVTRGHHLQPHAAQRLGLQAVGEYLARREQRHGGIQLGILQARQQVRAPAGGHLRAQLGVIAGQPPQGIEQHHFADALRHAQAQQAAGRGVVGHQLTQGVDLAQHLAALLEDAQAHRCRFQRFGVAVEQLYPQRLFQALHPPGDGRLGQLQAFRRLAEGLAADYRDEGVDVVDFHGYPALDAIYAY